MSISDALKRIPTNSLLVSTEASKLIRFYCPIKAICCRPIAGYKNGDVIFIDGIYHNENDELLYLIDGLRLPHRYFHIHP